MATGTTMRDYWHAGEYTTSRNDSGYCPPRTCDHQHRSREAARRCASANYPWVVYYVDKKGVTRRP
jgi:hypothetical protein